MQTQHYTLLSQWAEQEAVILAWPHAGTDWIDNLDSTQQTYLALINAINSASAVVILLCPQDHIECVTAMLGNSNQLLIVPAQYNDTWVRDYAFLTVSDNHHNYPMSFTFNGWGQKFDASLDNKVNNRLAELCQHPLIVNPTVLEGGAIEIDENQHLLTTASCLYNPKRNGYMTDEEYRALFADYLGAKKVTIFNHGHLEGDDTDGHIDTLARFTPLMGIVLQGADNRPHDPHFAELFKLQYEVSQVLPKHKIYSLPLPFVTNQDGERLPASYANYLILNRHILMPIYGHIEDASAIEIVQSAYPNYQIVPVLCDSLVQQNGSLHCVSMQVPANTIKPQIIAKAQSGVSVL
ncbi:MAG: agmatine/peptidylarginine deiminase [Alphaproteobacteria bacterium]|jgi:agmatine/peptidylarginine deiminase